MSLVTVVTLSSCGSAASDEAEVSPSPPITTSSSTPPTTPTTSTTSPTTESTTPSTSPSDDESTADGSDSTPVDDDSTDGSSDEETPEVLSTESSGKELGLPQVFAVVGDWDSERYSGAGQSDVRGMGLDLQGCFTSYDQAESYGSGGIGQLELRLDRKFERITFDAFQTNSSTSSDETLVVEVLAGGEQVDIRRITFDKLQDFDLPIAGKNAVKIRLFLEKHANCDSRTGASAAITNLTVV